VFDEEGVCSGCRVHEEKDCLDWDSRLEKLIKITNDYKVKSRSIHDCIVPVTGARDSFFIVYIVKHILKLNPLLVHYNKHYNTELGIRNLSYLKTLFGCDLITQTISPEKVKKITLKSIKKMGSIYWHCLAGTTVFPVHIAVKLKIPLIIWGVHQGCDQVGMFSHLDEVEMTRKYRKEHDLLGVEAEELIKGSQSLTIDDMEPYIYPHDKELESVGVRGIYLSNYIKWDAKKQHEKMIKEFNYKTSAQQRTFDNYSDIDCAHYSGLHDFIKYLKFGYGKSLDHACREIRLKRMTREKGVEFVNKYSNIFPKDQDLFLDWLGINSDELYCHIDKYRSRDIWNETNGNWELLDSIANHKDDKNTGEVKLKCNDNCNYKSIGEYDYDPEKKYLLIGRGWDN